MLKKLCFVSLIFLCTLNASEQNPKKDDSPREVIFHSDSNSNQLNKQPKKFDFKQSSNNSAPSVQPAVPSVSSTQIRRESRPQMTRRKKICYGVCIGTIVTVAVGLFVIPAICAPKYGGGLNKCGGPADDNSVPFQCDDPNEEVAPANFVTESGQPIGHYCWQAKITKNKNCSTDVVTSMLPPIAGAITGNDLIKTANQTFGSFSHNSINCIQVTENYQGSPYYNSDECSHNSLAQEAQRVKKLCSPTTGQNFKTGKIYRLQQRIKNRGRRKN